MDADAKKFLIIQVIWIGISLAISIALSLVLPFPLSIIAVIAVILLFNFAIRRRQIRKMGLSRGGFSILGSNNNSSGINYYCMNCGSKHREASCPYCGSKVKRAGF
jgi:hypothetical protein